MGSILVSKTYSTKRSKVSTNASKPMEAEETTQTVLNLDMKGEGSIWHCWHAAKNKPWQSHRFDGL